MTNSELSSPAPSPGGFVDLFPNANGNLGLYLTKEGRECADDILAERNRNGTYATLAMILADHLERDWELLAPRELGALTDAPIL